MTKITIPFHGEGLYYIDSFGSPLRFYEERSCYASQKETRPHLGDKVKIVDNGGCYSTYTDWFKDNDSAGALVPFYPYGINVSIGEKGTIMLKGKHSVGDPNTMLYAVKIDGGQVFLVDDSTFEVVED